MSRHPILNKITWVTYQPVVLFFLFFLSNALLAYSHFSITTKLWIGLFGLIFPMGWALSRVPPAHSENTFLFRQESFPAPTAGVFILLFFVAFFIRLYHLTSLSVWPMWDEGHYSFFAIDLAEKWKWHFFFGAEQDLPIFIWIQGLFYKLAGPSLFSMWLYAALYSILTLLLGFWAARSFFSHSISILYFLLLAFSFWPIFACQFAGPIGITLVYEFCILLLIGMWLKSLNNINNFRILRAIGLGLAVGLGCLCSKFWIISIPLFVLLLFFVSFVIFKRKKYFYFFLLGIIFFLSPIAVLALKAKYGGHILAYSLFNQNNSFGVEQLRISLSYLTVFLWGTLDKSCFNFGPLWGGFLNPLLGSAFLIGLVVLFQLKKKNIFFLILGFFFLGFIPGVLSKNLEMMRILPLLPLSLLLIALGLQRLLFLFPRSKRFLVLLVFVLFSISLDRYHLFIQYHSWAIPGAHSGSSKSTPRYMAFQILDQLQAKEGPALILTEFVANIFDQSLLVATYPFNAARNPTLNSQSARWAAVLADASFAPYLSKRFPRKNMFRLCWGLPASEGDLILFTFPLDEQTRPIAQKWLEAHRKVQNLYTLMPYNQATHSCEAAIRALEGCHNAFENDPFLKSCYLEKLSELRSQRDETTDQSMETLLEGIQECDTDSSLGFRRGFFWKKMADGYQNRKHDNSLALEALYQALRSGYETEGLYQMLAQLENARGNHRQASWAVQQVWKLQTQNPPPPGLIQWRQSQVTSSGGRWAIDYYMLGKLFLSNKQFGEAKDCFLQAGKMDRDFEPPPETLTRLDRLGAKNR